jgi:hypothetical protein
MALENLPEIPKYTPVAYVYAIFCVEGTIGFLKVGYSTEPFRRVSAICGASPLTPVRIGMVKAGDIRDGKMVEAAFHKRLAPRRVAQEWFKYDLSDKAQKAEFEQYSKHGFSKSWQTFPFDSMKEMLRREAAKAFAVSQKKKRTKDNPYDKRWMKGTKTPGKVQSCIEHFDALDRRKNCKLSSLK